MQAVRRQLDGPVVATLRPAGRASLAARDAGPLVGHLQVQDHQDAPPRRRACSGGSSGHNGCRWRGAAKRQQQYLGVERNVTTPPLHTFTAETVPFRVALAIAPQGKVAVVFYVR